MAIPERFLPRVLRDLARAGLVEAQAGPGRRLSPRAAGRAISLLDVIDAVEPADDGARCVLRGIPCGVDGRCQVHDAFDEARRRTARGWPTPASLARRRRADREPGPAGPTRRAEWPIRSHASARLFMY